MNDIKQDKYILGQSTSKEIEDSGQEIRLDLILEPNNTPLGGEVFGYVRDGNNNPISNALVKIMSNNYDPLMHTLTDADGKYLFVNVMPGSGYNIFAIAKGTKISEGNIFSMGEMGSVNINFTLNADPAMKLGIIAGDLISNTNNPVSGAIVSLYKKNIDNSKSLQAITYTNEYGQFVFREIEKGAYVIIINALGYNSISTEIFLNEDGEIVPVNISIVENPVNQNGTVSGVIEDNTNTPINRADVILYQVKPDSSLVPVAFTKTNENGVYLFTNVPKGIYKIKANEFKVKTIEVKSSKELSPYFIGFSIMSREKYMSSKYTMAEASLQNNALLESNNLFVENIGGDNKGSATITVNVPTDGEYDLIFEYLSGDNETTINLKINGIESPSMYTLQKTNSFKISDMKKINTTINLKSGDNTIKFFNDTGALSPNIGNVMLYSKTKVSTDYKIDDAKLFGFAKIEDNLIKNIGTGLGYITLDVDAPHYGYYDFIINYVTKDIYKKSNIDINGIPLEEPLIFDKTKSLDISSSEDKIIPIKLNKGLNTIKIYND